jgi:hypothetical protein
MLVRAQDYIPTPYPNKQVLVLVYSVQEKQPQAKKIKIERKFENKKNEGK